MVTHSSVLAWRIPGTGEPGGLPSMGSHRVGHDWSNLAAEAAAAYHCLLVGRSWKPICASFSSSENWKVIATTWIRFLLLLSRMTTNLVTYYLMVLKVRGQKKVWLGYSESAGLHFLCKLEGRGHFLTSVQEAAWYLSSWPSPIFKTANMSLRPLLLLLHLLIWLWPSCLPLSFIGPWLLCWLT